MRAPLISMCPLTHLGLPAPPTQPTDALAATLLLLSGLMLVASQLAPGSVVPYQHGMTAVNNAYAGGVYSPNQNHIYFVPFEQADEATWHYVDCATGVVVGYQHGVTAVNAAYEGGVYSPNQDRIYFLPCAQADEPTWHYVDCATGDVVEYQPRSTTRTMAGCTAPMRTASTSCRTTRLPGPPGITWTAQRAPPSGTSTE